MKIHVGVYILSGKLRVSKKYGLNAILRSIY